MEEYRIYILVNLLEMRQPKQEAQYPVARQSAYLDVAAPPPPAGFGVGLGSWLGRLAQRNLQRSGAGTTCEAETAAIARGSCSLSSRPSVSYNTSTAKT